MTRVSKASRPSLRVSVEARAGKPDALVVFALEQAKGGPKLLSAAVEADKKSGGALSRALQAEKFSGKKAQLAVLPALPGVSAQYVIVAGLGAAEELTLACFEKIGAALLAALNSKKAESADIIFPADKLPLKDISANDAAVHLAQAALLGSYRFDKYLTREPKDKKPTLTALRLVTPHAAAVKKLFDRSQKLAEGVFLTRDLVSEAPNVLYPESFAATIRRELTPLGVEVKVLDRRALEKMGAGALLAVGCGSERPPVLVSMQWKGGPKNAKNVGIVGKGITFDTGGISLKPGPGMEEMKWDMAGAGVVVGLMKTLALRRAKVNVAAVVALAENMPSGAAYRPGDIVTSLSGQTIEVHNTDAEGRLVLADALWYCQEKFKPTHIVDLATLTGAVIVALGHEYAAVFSNDDALAEDLLGSGVATGETLWRMPLNDAWDKAIDTPQADMKNIAASRDAGSAVGAHFLQRFIQKGVKWAHLDIAGVAWAYKDRPGVPKGASAFGVRLLDRFVSDVFES